jgi:uncharacterized protein (TIGR02246 family)
MKHRLVLVAAAIALPLLPAHAQAQPSSLEQRVQRIEDEAAIRKVILDYAVRLDARDFDGYVALFAKDGTWQNGNTVKHGRDEIRQMLVGIYGEQKPGSVNTDSYRIVSNVEVELNGDRATAHSRQLTIMRGENGSPTPRLSGIYDDEFIREDGAWKILHRTDRTIMPSPAEWQKQMAELRAKQAQK